MPFHLTELTSPTSFDALWPLHFLAFRTPYNPLSKHFNPIHTTLAAAIEASKARHVKMWRENKSCRWVEAVDDASGEVVGGACWMFNLLKEETKELEKKRDEGGGSGEGVDANWHVEGSEEKRFAERLIEGMRGFVGGKVGGVPHLELSQIIVHPASRDQGIGRMLIDWGTRRASELGVDSIVVSVPYAVPVYEKCGFGVLDRIEVDFSMDDPSEKWREYASEDLTTFLMWKPAGWACGDGERPGWDGGS